LATTARLIDAQTRISPWTAANITDLEYLTQDRAGELGFVVGELGAVRA